MSMVRLKERQAGFSLSLHHLPKDRVPYLQKRAHNFLCCWATSPSVGEKWLSDYFMYESLKQIKRLEYMYGKKDLDQWTG